MTKQEIQKNVNSKIWQFLKENVIYIILSLGLIVVALTCSSCKVGTLYSNEASEKRVYWHQIHAILDLTDCNCQNSYATCTIHTDFRHWHYPALCDSCQKYARCYVVYKNEIFDVLMDDFVEIINKRGTPIIYKLYDYKEFIVIPD